jgi:TPP-dependent pyruvate/acetoin dehydrogenase alpha subunit
MYGHSGLMGDQVPIAVGACLAGIGPCLAIMGDASGEEDYALASFGFAAKHRLPILFLVEDNNLSILTEKKVRRDWHHDVVARSFGLTSYRCNDSIKELSDVCEKVKDNLPALINVTTNRLVWHAGGGVDAGYGEDRLETELSSNPISNVKDIELEVEELWDSQLQRL